MGAMFGSAICLLGQLRGKSDLYNHTIAGMLAGTVWGVKCKTFFYINILLYVILNFIYFSLVWN